MKPAAARTWSLGVALFGAVLVCGACSVSELGLVNEAADQTIVMSEDNDEDNNEGNNEDNVGGDELATAEAARTSDDEQVEVKAATGTVDDQDDQVDQDGARAARQDQEPSDVLAGPRLPVDSELVFRSGTCFQPPFAGGPVEQVPCEEPHQIQVFASRQLPPGPDDQPPSADAAASICNEAFSAIAGVGFGLATVLDPSVLLPSAASWAEGERAVTCYVVYPEPTVDALADINPLRIENRVSIYGLQNGDCLVDLDPTETSFELTACDKPHDGEVFATYDLPVGVFPGVDLIESLAAQLCFGQGFTDFIGIPFSDSVIDALQSAPTAETWALGHHRISCIATDGLVRTDSLGGVGR